MADEQALASQLDLWRVCRRTEPALATTVLGATVLGGLLPTAFSVAAAATIGTLRAASRTGLDSPAGHRLDLLLGVAVFLFVAMQALGPVRETLADSMMVRLDADMARRLMRLTSGPPGVAHLEDPALVDRLEQAQGAIGGSTAGGAVYALSIVWLRRLGGAASVVLLAALRWWLAPVVVAAQLVVFPWRRRNWAILTHVVFGRSDALRRSPYLRRVAVDAATAKETRVFGLDRWLVDCYRSAFVESMTPIMVGPAAQRPGVRRRRAAGRRGPRGGAGLLLVLDEPTASLDAATEHALFERFAAQARTAGAETGAITVLVSHRFSTVRMADLILVVAGGKVVEAGSHHDLLRLGGQYAELYRLQAAGYR